MFNWSGLRALVELVHARGDRELDLALVAHGDRARGAGDRQHSAEGPELAVIGVRADLDLLPEGKTTEDGSPELLRSVWRSASHGLCILCDTNANQL